MDLYQTRETQQSVKIPLLNPAKEIIEKYKENRSKEANEVFPVISNQKTNKYLKEIIQSNGVRKKITFHSARLTFATVVTLSNGVPIETVSKLLGHTKLSTTQIYARVLESKLSSDISNLDEIMINKRQRNMN